jgi:hypothetical protein
MHVQPLLARETLVATVTLHQDIPSADLLDSPVNLAADSVTTQSQTPMLVQEME